MEQLHEEIGVEKLLRKNREKGVDKERHRWYIMQAVRRTVESFGTSVVIEEKA